MHQILEDCPQKGNSIKSCKPPRLLFDFCAMKKFASTIAMLVALSALGSGAFAAEGAESAAALKERVKALEEQVAQLKAKISEQAKFDAEIISKIRAENRALKKRLRSARLAAASAEIEVPEARDSKERAAEVERKTEERISEKESEDGGFHMFPF